MISTAAACAVAVAVGVVTSMHAHTRHIHAHARTHTYIYSMYAFEASPNLAGAESALTRQAELSVLGLRFEACGIFGV